MKNGATFSVTDLSTGRRWDVEAIQQRRNYRPEFGESLSEKCDGAITEAESKIHEGTHKNVRYAGNPLEVDHDHNPTRVIVERKL